MTYQEYGNWCNTDDGKYHIQMLVYLNAKRCYIDSLKTISSYKKMLNSDLIKETKDKLFNAILQSTKEANNFKKSYKKYQTILNS